MNVAEQTTLTSTSPRHIPSAVRLGPDVLRDLCLLVGSGNGRLNEWPNGSGLLFGTPKQDLLCVEALKSFPPADAAEDGSPGRNSLETTFDQFLAYAETDSAAKSLELVGWYCVRCPADTALLSDSEISFHNRHFRRATDVALLVRPRNGGASLEFYSRPSLKPSLSRQDFRSGLVLLDSASPISTLPDVAMGEVFDDERHLRVFEVLDNLDRAERNTAWRRSALRLKETTTRLARLPAFRPSLQAGSLISKARSAHLTHRTILALAILVFSICFALTWFYTRPHFSTLPVSVLFRRVGKKSLNIKVQPQKDGSLLVQWDPNSNAAQFATRGILTINDGSEHHALRLDSSQIGNGSLLYTPTSKDLTFQLQVAKGNEPPVSETMRVVNGTKSVLTAHTITDRESIRVTNAKPGPSEKLVQKPDTSSRLKKAEANRNNPGETVRHESPKVPGQLKDAFIETPKALKETPGAQLQKRGSPISGNPGLSGTTANAPIPKALSSISAPKTVDSISPKYLPARPLKEVMPSARSLVSSALSGASDIEVEVRIDDEGHVTDARVVNSRSSDNQVLIDAALAAAREWIFEPARMHGKNVPSDHTIDFRFHPQAQQQ